MNSFMSTFFGPIFNEKYCEIFQGISIAMSFFIILNIIQFIYLIYISKQLGKKSYIIIIMMISPIITNLFVYFLARLVYGICLKSLN